MSIRFVQGKLKGEERQSIIQEIQRQSERGGFKSRETVFTAFSGSGGDHETRTRQP